MSKILVIEDEANISELISFNLKNEGYDVICCDDGKAGFETAKTSSPDLIILDIMLPKMDGYDVIKTLRSDGDETPVIMLTAKNDEVDKIVGLEFGADDYMTKPFSVRELKARIKAVLRRYEKTSKNDNENDHKFSDNENKDILIIDDLEINIPSREVKVGGKPLTLSMKEFDLLRILAENRNIVLTRDRLLDTVWGYEYYGETRTVDVHIRNLRRKLSEHENKYIATVRGVGYKMV